MQRYGLIVADNGSDMYISGAFDPRWNNDILNPAFRSLNASDFEVIELGWRGDAGRHAPLPGSAAPFTFSQSGAFVVAGVGRGRGRRGLRRSKSARRPDSRTCSSQSLGSSTSISAVGATGSLLRAHPRAERVRRRAGVE